jgi:PKD repeat protein
MAVGTVTGHTVAFSAAGSTAVGPATITARSWDFGNGVTSTTANPTYRYTTAGTYTVTLTVTDSNGLTDTDTITVTPVDGSGSANFISFAGTNLTAHGGTLLSVLGDVDPTTFDSGDGVNKSTGVGVFSALIPPLAGKPFVAVVRMDNWSASVAAVNAQIFDYNGTTQRSAVTNIPVLGYQSVADGGIPGTGTLAAGVVNKFVVLEFPAVDCALVSLSGWDRLTLKMQEV